MRRKLFGVQLLRLQTLTVGAIDAYLSFVVLTYGFECSVNGTDVYAVLRYVGASSAEPSTPQPTVLPPGGVAFQEFNLKVRI